MKERWGSTELSFRWENSELIVPRATLPSWKLLMVNTGSLIVEFASGPLVAIGQLVELPSRRWLREPDRMLMIPEPLISYRLKSGESKEVRLLCELSDNELLRLAPGMYEVSARFTFPIPLSARGTDILLPPPLEFIVIE